MTKGYSAKWIISADGKLHEDCTLLVDEGKIEKIVKTSELNEAEPQNIKSYGRSVITPGFVNLHSQLQYTNIGKVHSKGFVAFLKRFFMKLKMQYFLAGIPKSSFIYRLSKLLSEYFSWARSEKLASFKKGIEESMLSGTTCVVQLSKESKYFEILNEVPIKTYLFFELFSDSAETSKEEFRSIQKKIDKLLKNKSENTFVGVAPHSVCSVHKRLWKTLMKYCRKNNILLTTRIAEGPDEIDWLKHGFSDIDILNTFTGNKKFEPFIKGVSPVTYLNELGIINKKMIAVYLNYATDDDLEILSQQGAALAYCPRVSENLRCKVLEFDKVLKYFPKKFGFGTNSLAFNEDSSLLKELRSVNEGRLNVLDAIEYLTVVPAQILRIDNKIGTLEKGKDADFNVFKLRMTKITTRFKQRKTRFCLY
jgi:cytosine/adenosine deaminase-related metal-dependent hydrolase